MTTPIRIPMTNLTKPEVIRRRTLDDEIRDSPTRLSQTLRKLSRKELLRQRRRDTTTMVGEEDRTRHRPADRGTVPEPMTEEELHQQWQTEWFDTVSRSKGL
jgi:hypothetical protein